MFPLMIWVPVTCASMSHTYGGTYMACCHPLKAFWTGCYTDSGALDLVIMPSTSGNYLHPKVAERKGHHVSAFAPMTKMNGEAYLCDPLYIPCSSCVGCRMDRARQWKVRCCKEAELYKDDVHFVTLTYDDAHLPVNEDGEPTLMRRHVQLFMKRLRFRNRANFRYFGCMEYGEHGHRPHAHITLFGKLPDLVPVEFKKYTSEWILDAWTDFAGDRKPRGNILVEPCNENTIAYVAGYVEKKQKDPFFDSYPVKPFLFMSTKPGIGSHVIDQLDGHRKIYGNFGNVHHAGIPKAFLKKCKDKPWYAFFKDESKLIAQSCLIANYGVCKTQDEELIGYVYEDAYLHQLENLRSAKL